MAICLGLSVLLNNGNPSCVNSNRNAFASHRFCSRQRLSRFVATKEHRSGLVIFAFIVFTAFFSRLPEYHLGAVNEPAFLERASVRVRCTRFLAFPCCAGSRRSSLGLALRPLLLFLSLGTVLRRLRLSLVFPLTLLLFKFLCSCLLKQKALTIRFLFITTL